MFITYAMKKKTERKSTILYSIVPMGNHTYLILNYSNPLDECEDWPWIWGQVSPGGTLIYGITVAFEKQNVV